MLRAMSYAPPINEYEFLLRHVMNGDEHLADVTNGAYDIDDIAAHGGGSVADPLYAVRFTSRELWGEAGADGEVVCVNLFERYLEDPQ